MQIPAAFFSGEEALMPYAHQDALQRVCAEVERVVWPIDRDFAQKGRRYWIRPAEDIEVSERELMDMVAAPPLPSGWRAYVVVKVFSPGVRMRMPFFAPDIGDEWRHLPEVRCHDLYHHWLAQQWEGGAMLKLDKELGEEAH